MLPGPTAEAMILMGLLATLAKGKPDRCLKITRGIHAALGAQAPKVRRLRETVPALQDATDGAKVIMRTRCFVCPMRKDCDEPLDTA